MAAPTAAPEKQAVFEPESVLRRLTLRRALREPGLLEECLINPGDVTQRYGISLSDEEMTKIRQASHFFASWDSYCGNGAWLDDVVPGETTERHGSGESIADVVTRAVRARIAEEIMWELPVAIRRVADRFGADLLSERDLDAETPVALRPLVNAFRTLARTIARDVNHELSTASLHATLGRTNMVQSQTQAVPQPPAIPTPTGDGTTQVGMMLATYLSETVNHAVTEAIQRIAPRTHEPFDNVRRQPRIEPRREPVAT
jgi:hypothetical protein